MARIRAGRRPGNQCIVRAVENAVISCHGLKKYYPDVKAVDGLDLSVAANECFGLLGPNGAGKNDKPSRSWRASPFRTAATWRSSA